MPSCQLLNRAPRRPVRACRYCRMTSAGTVRNVAPVLARHVLLEQPEVVGKPGGRLAGPGQALQSGAGDHGTGVSSYVNSRPDSLLSICCGQGGHPVASVRVAPSRSAPVRSAPVRFALVRSAPVRFARLSAHEGLANRRPGRATILCGRQSRRLSEVIASSSASDSSMRNEATFEVGP